MPVGVKLDWCCGRPYKPSPRSSFVVFCYMMYSLYLPMLSGAFKAMEAAFVLSKMMGIGDEIINTAIPLFLMSVYFKDGFM